MNSADFCVEVAKIVCKVNTKAKVIRCKYATYKEFTQTAC